MKIPLISYKVLLTISLFVSSDYLHAQDLFQAIRKGNYEKVEQIILQNPSWVDSTNKYGSQPLYLASFYRNEKITELLIENGADMYFIHPDDGRTALHTAVLWSRIPIAQVLLNYGMDVNVKDTENKTPIIRAIEKKNKKLVEVLLAHNAKLPHDTNDINRFLHFAVQYDLPDLPDTLIEKGASLFSVDNKW